MAEINFCETKEQITHFGEVVTGKVDGSPTGADIDTSTLPYTGQVRKTLPALESEYQTDIDNFNTTADQVITDKTAEFDAVIAASGYEVPVPYVAGLSMDRITQTVIHQDNTYHAINVPFVTSGAFEGDANWKLLRGALKTDIYKPNHLRNPNFTVAAPGVVIDATPQDFAAGEPLRDGWVTNEACTGVTYINGELSLVTGSYYQDILRTGTSLEYLSEFTTSVSIANGEPTEVGVSWSVVGNSFRVVVTEKTVFSVCFNEGGFAASHSVYSSIDTIEKISQYKFSSIENLKVRKSTSGSIVELYLGNKVNTGTTDWLIVNTSVNSLSILGGLYAIPLNGMYLSDYENIDLSGVIPCDSEINEAITVNRTSMLPNSTLQLSSRKVLRSSAIFRGVGPESAIDAQMTDVLFEFPRECGRSVKAWGGFTVISKNNTMTDGVVFLIPGTESGGVLKYTSGFKFENIEIGGGGNFGCIWDASDTFRLTIRDCGYSYVTNPVRIRGSVVQCTIDNLTGNNLDYTRSYDGENAGVYMQSRSDYSDLTLRVPENVKILNSGFVKHRRGILSVGLAVSTVNCDLDFIQDIGWEYGGGDGHSISGGYIAHSGVDTPFIGILAPRAQDLDAVEIEDVTINAYASVSSKQTAVQVGSGDAAPYAEPSGVSVTGVKVFGPASSWDFGVQADRCRSVEISNNKFKANIIKSGGKAINASNSKNLTCNSNKCRQQEIYITAPDPTAVITAVNNDADVVYEFIAPPASNIEIARNRNLPN